MRILSILLHDLRLLSRDRRQIINLFLLPLAFILPISMALGKGDGYGITSDNRRQSLPVVNLDGGEYAQKLVTALQENVWVEQNLSLEWAAYLGLDTDPACQRSGPACDELMVNEALARSQRNVALVIPAGFSQAVAAGQKTQVTMLYNPTGDAVQRLQMEGVVEAATVRLSLEQTVNQGLGQLGDLAAFGPANIQTAVKAQQTQGAGTAQQPAFSIRPVQPSNVQLAQPPDTYQQTVPGYTVMYVFFIVTYLSANLHEEKRLGTFRRLFSTPTNRFELMAGKLLSAVIINLLQVAVMFAVGHFMFGLQLGNDPLALVLLTLALSLAAVGAGLACSASRIGGSAMVTTLMLGALLGGCMFPLDLMPSFLRVAGLFVPHYWAMQGYLSLLARGQGLAGVLPQIGVLLVFAAAFFGLAVKTLDLEE